MVEILVCDKQFIHMKISGLLGAKFSFTAIYGSPNLAK